MLGRCKPCNLARPGNQTQNIKYVDIFLNRGPTWYVAFQLKLEVPSPDMATLIHTQKEIKTRTHHKILLKCWPGRHDCQPCAENFTLLLHGRQRCWYDWKYCCAKIQSIMFEGKLWNAACRRRHQIHQPFWTDYSPPSSDWLEPQHGHYGECLQWPQVFAHSKPKLSETSETVRLCEISIFRCIQMYYQYTKNNALGAGAWVSNYLSIYLSIYLSNLSCPILSYLSYLSFVSYLSYLSIRSILSILPI